MLISMVNLKSKRRKCYNILFSYSYSSLSFVLLFLLSIIGFHVPPFLFINGIVSAVSVDDSSSNSNNDNNNNNNNGLYHYKIGQELFIEEKYDEAAMSLWKAILLYEQTAANSNQEDLYDVTTVFQQFMSCYSIQNKIVDGLAFVSLESYKRKQYDMGYNYLQQAISIDSNNELVLYIQTQFSHLIKLKENASNNNNDNDPSKTSKSDKKKKKKKKQSSSSKNNKQSNKSSLFGISNNDIINKTSEQLYEIASQYFSNKNYEQCADIFEISCIQSQYQLGPSCANAVYCRNLIVDWGYNGSQFSIDMKRIISLTQQEVQLYRYKTISTTSNTATDIDTNKQFGWTRTTSVHPHMMLGYPIDPMLKRYSAESTSYLDEKSARVLLVPPNSTTIKITNENQLPSLPIDMPYNIELMRQQYQKDFQYMLSNTTTTANTNTNTTTTRPKIRVGFVGSGFNSKAVLFLSHDMFRFFNKSIYEIHIFSFGPADSTLFIKHSMNNINWRQRVISNVHYFHDCLQMKLHTNHIHAAQYIRNHNIHILIEWDGFARQGERAQGLFALRPSPIQILHQEYLGTSGAQYVDYLFSDKITTPSNALQYYTEKIIWLPNHFFSKGHAFQKEVHIPTIQYKPVQYPYIYGTGSPQENRCLSNNNNRSTNQNISFVYCNFNKLLKSNPDTVRSWIQILQSVPNSILCLLENPKSAILYFRKFIYEATSSVSLEQGDDINSRIFFLPWENNPFYHQIRNQDMCNVMLDSHPYNGHTVAQDALYGGVPIVTRSDSLDMSSRVTTSANVVLGLDTILNAYNGIEQYITIATQLGINKTLYTSVRTKLITTCNQRNPMHPYWDVVRYVRNFENGLYTVWERYINGLQPDHITVIESNDIIQSGGTYDIEINKHPTMGKHSNNVITTTM